MTEQPGHRMVLRERQCRAWGRSFDLHLTIGPISRTRVRCHSRPQGTGRRIVLETGLLMHELSIVASVVDSVTESLEKYPGARVLEVRLKVGALAAVVEDSLAVLLGHCHGRHAAAQVRSWWYDVLPVVCIARLAAPTCEIESLQSFRCARLRRAGQRYAPGPRTGNRSIEIEEARGRRVEAMTTRIVELRQGILKKNDELARGLRDRFTSAGVLVLNLVSSPGTGKTAFLERTLRDLLRSAAPASPPWWAISKPTTMLGAWPPAARPSARSTRMASATLKPRWSASTWKAGTA